MIISLYRIDCSMCDGERGLGDYSRDSGETIITYTIHMLSVHAVDLTTRELAKIYDTLHNPRVIIKTVDEFAPNYPRVLTVKEVELYEEEE